MNRADNQGFTIIELMLAMTFISVLLLGIAMTVIQIGTVYNKGMALKEVNQTARDLAAEVQRSVASVGAINIDQDYRPTTSGGRLCLGTVSYIWNTGTALEKGDSATVWYENDPTHAKKIRFVKVPDTSRIYCAENGVGALTYATIRTADVDLVQEMIREGETTLNIHRFVLSSEPSAHDDATGQYMYSLDYTIGSGSVDAMTTAADPVTGRNVVTGCKAPGIAGSDIAYCNVQPFSLVIRAGSRV